MLVSLLVVLATLGSINASILTGARTNYAVGQDISPLSFLDRWQPGTSSPTAAYLFQGAIALALVGLGTLTRPGGGMGLETMVDLYGSLFFIWGFFFAQHGVADGVELSREPRRLRPFECPFTRPTPPIFCSVCLICSFPAWFMPVSVPVGVLVLFLGIPLIWHTRP